MLKLLSIPLLLAFIGCSEKTKTAEPIDVRTPDGNITAHKTTVDPVPQKVEKVTGDGLKRLQSLSMLGPSLVATYLPNGQNPDLKTYDRAFRAWQTSSSPKHTKEQVIETLGGYLGNKCVAELNMEWVTVTDKYGTDYAVRSKTAEVMAFPFSTVMKRIEDKEYDFMNGVYYTIKQTLESGDYKTRQ